MRLIETFSEGDYTEYEVFECKCGWRATVIAGGDIAGCPRCEAEYPEIDEVSNEVYK